MKARIKKKLVSKANINQSILEKLSEWIDLHPKWSPSKNNIEKLFRYFMIKNAKDLSCSHIEYPRLNGRPPPWLRKRILNQFNGDRRLN